MTAIIYNQPNLDNSKLLELFIQAQILPKLDEIRSSYYYYDYKNYELYRSSDVESVCWNGLVDKC